MNEVYIADQSVRPIVDDAVLQAMTNKGIHGTATNSTTSR